MISQDQNKLFSDFICLLKEISTELPIPFFPFSSIAQEQILYKPLAKSSITPTKSWNGSRVEANTTSENLLGLQVRNRINNGTIRPSSFPFVGEHHVKLQHVSPDICSLEAEDLMSENLFSSI
ncbi:hypothetical protein Peur_017847 [Populus x canadensis]